MAHASLKSLKRPLAELPPGWTLTDGRYIPPLVGGDMPQLKDFLIAGGLYVDELHEVPAFPAEDSTSRALSVRRRRGGNAASTSAVLSQLAQPGSSVRWMGAVPAADLGGMAKLGLKTGSFILVFEDHSRSVS